MIYFFIDKKEIDQVLQKYDVFLHARWGVLRHSKNAKKLESFLADIKVGVKYYCIISIIIIVKCFFYLETLHESGEYGKMCIDPIIKKKCIKKEGTIKNSSSKYHSRTCCNSSSKYYKTKISYCYSFKSL